MIITPVSPFDGFGQRFFLRPCLEARDGIELKASMYNAAMSRSPVEVAMAQKEKWMMDLPSPISMPFYAYILETDVLHIVGVHIICVDR